jgi:hypothetical protein
MQRFLQVLCAGAILTATAPALAAFSLHPGYPQREGGESRPIVVLGDPRLYPTAGFNRADCLDAAQSVRLALADIPAEATDVELWVRRDNVSCADPANRPGGANVQCWRAARWTRAQVANKIVSVSPTAIVAAIDKQMNVEEPIDATAACAKDAHMLPLAFTMQIMAFNAGTVVGWSSASGMAGEVIAVPTQYDLVGPAAPELLSAEAGNTSVALQLNRSYVASADWAGHDVYCFPLTSSSCTGHPLTPGQIPSAELNAHLCSTGSPSSEGSMTATGRTNDTTYAFALSARDKAGNHGPMSNVLCATPTGPTPPDTVTSGCSSATASAANGVPFAATLLVVTMVLRSATRRRNARHSARSCG